MRFFDMNDYFICNKPRYCLLWGAFSVLFMRIFGITRAGRHPYKIFYLKFQNIIYRSQTQKAIEATIKSLSRMKIADVTKALIAALPTPSAPPVV